MPMNGHYPHDSYHIWYDPEAGAWVGSKIRHYDQDKQADIVATEYPGGPGIIPALALINRLWAIAEDLEQNENNGKTHWPPERP